MNFRILCYFKISSSGTSLVSLVHFIKYGDLIIYFHVTIFIKTDEICIPHNIIQSLGTGQFHKLFLLRRKTKPVDILWTFILTRMRQKVLGTVLNEKFENKCKRIEWWIIEKNFHIRLQVEVFITLIWNLTSITLFIAQMLRECVKETMNFWIFLLSTWKATLLLSITEFHLNSVKFWAGWSK